MAGLSRAGTAERFAGSEWRRTYSAFMMRMVGMYSGSRLGGGDGYGAIFHGTVTGIVRIDQDAVRITGSAQYRPRRLALPEELARESVRLVLRRWFDGCTSAPDQVRRDGNSPTRPVV